MKNNMTMQEKFRELQQQKEALLATNFYNFETLQGVLAAARSENRPIILQLTRSSLEYMGLPVAVGLAGSMLAFYEVEGWLHLDHGDSYELVASCLDAGFTSVMIDASEKPFEENVKLTSRVVRLAEKYGVNVEAELGYVAKLGQKTDRVGFTEPDEARRFVEETGVNTLAIAIGSAHGFYKETPKLDLDRLSEIHETIDIPLVLHGGSGIPHETLREAVRRGICKINLATEIKNIFMKTLKSRLTNDEEIDLRKVFPNATHAVTELVRDKLQAIRTSVLLLLAATIFFTSGCRSTQGDEYYSLQDFSRLKKIDVHDHELTSTPDFVLQAKEDNFTLISLNTEVPDYAPIDSQQYYILQLRHTYQKDIFYVSTFSTQGINEPGWSDRQLAYLKKSFDSGALGIKVWKNIGLTVKDKDSNFILVDNPVFDPIFNYLEKNKIPVIGHIGEPKNCWLPLDQMTTNNDREYFTAHPEYHMFLHPEYPSYETIIRSRDHLLEKHPGLKFIGAHLASLEWDVDEIARRLDKFPNMSVEPAERFGQLEYQSMHNWQKVHDFFIKYQDRIMYGTDLEDNYSLDHQAQRKHEHELWMRDWKYLTSDDSLTSPFVTGKFKGLHLPRSVIDKIYYQNPEKWYFAKKEL